MNGPNRGPSSDRIGPQGPTGVRGPLGDLNSSDDRTEPGALKRLDRGPGPSGGRAPQTTDTPLSWAASEGPPTFRKGGTGPCAPPPPLCAPLPGSTWIQYITLNGGYPLVYKRFGIGLEGAAPPYRGRHFLFIDVICKHSFLIILSSKGDTIAVLLNV